MDTPWHVCLLADDGLGDVLQDEHDYCAKERAVNDHKSWRTYNQIFLVNFWEKVVRSRYRSRHRHGFVAAFSAFIAGIVDLDIERVQKLRKLRSAFQSGSRSPIRERYRRAKKLTVVMVQLNTHSAASFYEAFALKEAKWLASKIKIHYTPKHNSWLNIAEIEFSVLSRQCLKRRIARRDTLERHIEEWVERRNRTNQRLTGESKRRTRKSSYNRSTH